MARQPSPDRDSKGHQSYAADRRSGGVDPGGFSSALGSILAEAHLFLFFMLLDERGGRRENSRECEEETANFRAPTPCDYSCQDGYGASENESDNILVPV
jgi:hypothetical protein